MTINNEIPKTGIEKIDVQHMEILDWISQMQKNLSRDTVMDKICFLLNYVSFHFETEEHYMEVFVFPHLDEHRQIHKEFKEEILEILENFTKSGETSKIFDRIHQYAVPWIINHFTITDKEMATFMQSVTQNQ